MNEKLARTNRCCGPNGCGALINPISGGKIPEKMLSDLALEVNQPRWCVASSCMGWVWSSPVARNIDDGRLAIVSMVDDYPEKYELTCNSGSCGLANNV